MYEDMLHFKNIIRPLSSHRITAGAGDGWQQENVERGGGGGGGGQITWLYFTFCFPPLMQYSSVGGSASVHADICMDVSHPRLSISLPEWEVKAVTTWLKRKKQNNKEAWRS